MPKGIIFLPASARVYMNSNIFCLQQEKKYTELLKVTKFFFYLQIKKTPYFKILRFFFFLRNFILLGQ